MFRLITAAVAITIGSAVSGSPQALASSAAPASDGAGDGQVVCKYVVSAQRGAKPFQMCLTKSQWAAKEAKDSADLNRIECRYEEAIGSKLKSRKVCQPASEWAQQRRMHREQVQDIQMRVCVPGGGC